jgi:hypothetical protein
LSVLKFKNIVTALVLSHTPAFAQDAAVIPDPTLTPGAVRTTNLAEICGKGTRKFRGPHDAYAIMLSYGYPLETRWQYQIDHLIPLELGGADDEKNLWPEPYASPDNWTAARKDALENRLHVLVCEGHLNLQVAQKAFEDDWTAAWQLYVGHE